MQEPPLTSWESFRNHREIITSFIARSVAVEADSLCVLGAGLCNDLELNQLARDFSKITLVDISADDLEHGLKQQQMHDSTALNLINECDVTGVDQLLREYKDQPSVEKFEAIVAAASSYAPPIQKYDCVASTCILSQLLWHATDCVGEDHARFVELLQIVRQRHIEIMIEAVVPGGVGILVTDFVSSVSLPELFDTNNLSETINEAIKNKNFLHGLNPGLVAKVFEHPSIKPQLKSVRVSNPWRWALPDRIYACMAIIFTKK